MSIQVQGHPVTLGVLLGVFTDRLRLHRLKDDKRNLWSVRVSANWRITFEFEDGDAYILDLEDYH